MGCGRDVLSSEVLQQLPTEAVGAPSLDVFKSSLHGTLGSLIQWATALPTAVDWN